MAYTDVFGRPLEPDPPRPLTLPELRAIAKVGSPQLARFLAAGPCPQCGHSRASSFHREACDERLNPQTAPEKARQPWEPRPARRAA